MFCRAIAEGRKAGGESPCAGRHAIRKCVAGALRYPLIFGSFFGVFRCATVQHPLSDCLLCRGASCLIYPMLNGELLFVHCIAIILIFESRVRRDEVQSPTSSREPSLVDEADLQDAHARLGKLLDLDGLIGLNTATEDKDATSQPAEGNNDEDEQEFEFRLFSAPTKPKDTTTKEQGTTDGQTVDSKEDKTSGAGIKDKTTGTQKLRIRLRSPTPSGDPSEGRFVKASRGWQYYFSTPSLLGLEENELVKETIAEQRRQFEDMAVTGEHITTWAKAQPWVSYCSRTHESLQ